MRESSATASTESGHHCGVCGRPLHKPRRCTSCHQTFCTNHIRPRNHNCKNHRQLRPSPRNALIIVLVGGMVVLGGLYIPKLGGNPCQDSEEMTGDVVGALIVTMQTVQGDDPANHVHKSVIHLYKYASGSLAEVWSTSISGWVSAVSLNDINCDGKPEVVVMNKPAHFSNDVVVGDHSLRVYENISGSYQLAFIRPGQTNMVRGQTFRRYGDGGKSLLIIMDGKPCLLDYRSGKKPAVRELPNDVGDRPGLDVGDVNGDGRADIVKGLSYKGGGFYVLENKGRDNFRKRFFQVENPSIVEIRIGDVDHDKTNEIVMVARVMGEDGGEAPSLSVWEHLEGDYICVWSHIGRSIRSVDIGDVDGDGMEEIVTGCEGTRGISVWEFNKTSGSFYRSWEEDVNRTIWVKYDLSLRLSPLDESGLARIVGVGTDFNRSEMYLYIGQGTTGESPQIFWLWSGGTLHCPTLDVWPLRSEGS